MSVKLITLAGVALAFVSLGTGCADKTNAKIDALTKQNEQLAAQLRSEQEKAANAEARANAATASAVTPEPSAPAPSDPAIPDMTAPTASGNPDIAISRNARGETQLEIKGDVLFDTGKATLKPAAKKVLDSAAGMIKQRYSSSQLRIEGHTDPTPIKSTTWDDNWDLGSARARTVMLYLKSHGIKNMYIASFADTQLKSTKNYALDRRVDIVVVGK